MRGSAEPPAFGREGVAVGGNDVVDGLVRGEVLVFRLDPVIKPAGQGAWQRSMFR